MLVCPGFGYFLQVVAETDFKSCTFPETFHFHLLSGGGRFLFEKDVLVQQVVDLQLHREAFVEAVTACEVQRMYRLLLDVSQSAR